MVITKVFSEEIFFFSALIAKVSFLVLLDASQNVPFSPFFLSFTRVLQREVSPEIVTFGRSLLSN